MEIKQRATPEEWRLAESNNQASFLPSLDEAGAALKSAPQRESSSEPLNSSALEEVVKVLNRALAHGDATAIMNELGIIARERGMSHVARETGLARESLYRFSRRKRESRIRHGLKSARIHRPAA